MMKKRGLSTVVVTLIIVLVSLVAIGIIWFVIQNFVVGGSKEIGFGRFTINLDIINAYEQEGNITVNVKRETGGGDLSQIKFILSDGTNSETITLDTTLEELDDENFIIHPSELAPTQVASISIAPVYVSNGEDLVGEVVDTYNIISGGIALGDGNGGENCVPVCQDFQCGPDLICGQSCGTCEGTDECINHVCVSDNCSPESNETTCSGISCGTKVNNCGIMVNCGGCSQGQICQSGSCVSVLPVNSGKVEDIWPGTSGLYFGSSNLPTDVSYGGYYARFPGSTELDCLLIVNYIFPVSGYAKSHIAFNFETSIEVNNDYQIWRNIEECQSAA